MLGRLVEKWEAREMLGLELLQYIMSAAFDLYEASWSGDVAAGEH